MLLSCCGPPAEAGNPASSARSTQAGLLAVVAKEDGGRITPQDHAAHRVSRDHELPAALDDSAHGEPPEAGASRIASVALGSGGPSSLRRRSAATRLLSATSPIQRKRMPKALMRSGQWNALETVAGLDCAWWSEFHHFTEK